MKKDKPDYYAMLGVQRDASLGEIKQAYRELVRRHHPDAAGDSAPARAQFERIQEAYEVLSDPAKRAKYDAALPPRKYPVADLDAPGLWREAAALLLERSDSFSNLIQAMRAAVPVTMDGNVVVVGIAGRDQYLAGHLQVPGNRHRIMEALREISGQDIDYRVIEGTTQEDWEWVQRGEGRRPAREPAPAPPDNTAARKGARAKGAAHAPAAPPISAWDLLGRKIYDVWGSTANRHQPLTRAEFVVSCVQWITEASKQAAEDGMPADAVRREADKVIERVAQLIDLPPAVVALEVVRGHARRK